MTAKTDPAPIEAINALLSIVCRSNQSHECEQARGWVPGPSSVPDGRFAPRSSSSLSFFNCTHMPEKALLSTQGQRLLESIEGALISCNWTSWSHGAHSDSLKQKQKHRTPLNEDSANKIKALLRGSKLNDLSNAVALQELCSFETPSDTKLRVDNLNVTTAPFDAFGSLLDMLRWGRNK